MDDANHELYMREALAEAQKALDRGDRPVGCVIVHGDKIVARGSNHEFTKRSKFEHAETFTLRSCAPYFFFHANPDVARIASACPSRNRTCTSVCTSNASPGAKSYTYPAS